MNDQPWLEARVAKLISAYADEAPVAIDPAAMARLAAANTARRPTTSSVLGALAREQVWVAVVVALLAALVTGIMTVGSQLLRRPIDDLVAPRADLVTPRAVVAPFVGFAPDGADASGPASGELVVSFIGRIGGSGLYSMWLFTDGRLVWMSEDGNGDRAPAGAVVEQHLTPLGVELIRSRAAASVQPGRGFAAGHRGAASRAPVIWGSITVGRDGRGVNAGGVDLADLGLVDPGSWLPPEAWDDPVVRGFVPSRYAVCAWLDDTAADPAGEAGARMWSDEVRAALEAGDHLRRADAPDCRVIALEEARAMVAALPAVAMEPGRGPSFNLTAASGRRLTIDIVPVVPSGDVVCNCG